MEIWITYKILRILTHVVISEAHKLFWKKPIYHLGRPLIKQSYIR